MRINPALASDPARSAIQHDRPKHDFASMFSGQPHPANGGLLGAAAAYDAASGRGGAASDAGGRKGDPSVLALPGAAGSAAGASTLQQQSRERAFGLDELGMFGLQLDVALGAATPAAVAQTAIQPDRQAPAAAVPPSTLGGTAVPNGGGLPPAAVGAPVDPVGLVRSPAWVSPAMQPAATALPYGAAGEPAIGMGALQEAGGDAVTGDHAAAARAITAGPASPASRPPAAPARLAASSDDLSEPNEAPGSGRGEEPDLRAGDAKTQPSAETARAGERDGKGGPSLFVTSIGGALQVVAAAADVDPAAATRLRRMAEETAAAFGKRVHSISVNGRPIEPAPIGIKGGA
jgi:hypothetical protein